jgi:murein DD-endopeptidase MepM/ murein hydrolase activator NlpD
MAVRTKVDKRRCIAASLGLLVAALLAGCESGGPYADDSDLPQATYYTVVVRPGDTLSELAHRYDASIADVAELNRLGSESRIYAGQTLRVPAGDSGTRVAVLNEAGNSSSHNYAPPPKPIDVTRFESHGRVTVQNLSPPAAGNAQSAVRTTDNEMPRFTPAQEPVSRVARADQTTHGSGRFAWPVSGQVISPFGTLGRGERNDGINIAAEAGTPIHAAAAGTVTYAGNELKGYGNLVLIQHGDGFVTAYAHAQSISVSRGDRVEKGQVIGLSGATGDVDRPQLHFEIRKGAQPINPRLLLASRE